MSKFLGGLGVILGRCLPSAALAVGIVVGGLSAADAQTSITVVQGPDAQPRNILPTRGGNLPWIKSVFETLSLRDKETGEPQPLLATGWQLADDGLSISIQLRDDVTFHTGRPMTADNVKFTFETAAAPATAAQTGFIAREFSDVSVVSPAELTITFAKPLPSLFDFFEETSIIDKDTYDNRIDGSQVVGTGPYTFASWTPKAEIVLERYDGYRDPNAAKIDVINHAIIRDPTAILAALRSGRAEIAFNLVPRIAQTLERDPNYTLNPGGGAIFPLGLNVTKAPFDDKSVRQAIGYAIDRERINDQVFAGIGNPTPLFWNAADATGLDDLSGAYGYDPEKPKAMIDAAGAAGSAVKIIIPAIPPNRATAEIVQNNLTEAGFEVEVEVLGVPTYDKRQVAGDLDEAFILIHGLVGYSAETLLSAAPSLREGNPSQFWTDEYQSLRSALTGASADDRATALKALSEYMVDEAFSLAVVQSSNTTVISKKVAGAVISRRGHLLLGGASVDQ